MEVTYPFREHICGNIKRGRYDVIYKISQGLSEGDLTDLFDTPCQFKQVSIVQRESVSPTCRIYIRETINWVASI